MTYANTWMSWLLLAVSLNAGAVLGAAAKPQDFVAQAGAAGLYEVNSAELARDRTQDAQVRAFADQMFAHHSAANRELNSLANQHELMAPTEIDPKHQQLLDRLGKLEGRDFDREYAQQQLQTHQAAVTLFEEQAKSGTDDELRQWASQKVPILKAHLEHAQKLAAGDETQR